MASYRNGPARKNKVPEIRFNTRDVFAAACAAQRVNGEYLKQGEHDDEGELKRVANKYLTRDFVEGKFDIRDEDREEAENVIRHFQGLTFKILKGKILSEFATKALECANSETVSTYELAMISSLPSCYLRDKIRRDVDARLRDTNGHVGQVGDAVQLTIEVLRCNYSQQWSTWFITGITTDNKSVFFSFKRLVATGSTMNIQGKVKSHCEDTVRTQLNYVKEI